MVLRYSFIMPCQAQKLPYFTWEDLVNFKLRFPFCAWNVLLATSYPVIT